MHIQGPLKVKRRVLAENTTEHEVYVSLVCDFLGVEVIIEEPKHLREVEAFEAKKHDCWLILQLTSSGTVDHKIIPAPPVKTKEQLVEEKKATAKARVLANRTAPPAEANSVSDEELEAEMKKMDEEKSKDKSAKKNGTAKLEDHTTIKAEIVDGEVVP